MDHKSNVRATDPNALKLIRTIRQAQPQLTQRQAIRRSLGLRNQIGEDGSDAAIH
jgi:hypothetical protein